MVSQLEESQRQMKDALTMCKSAIEANDTSYVSDYSLKLEPDFREARTVFEAKEVNVRRAKNDRNDANVRYHNFRSRKSIHLKIRRPVSATTSNRTVFQRIHSRVVSMVDSPLDLDLTIPSETVSRINLMHSVVYHRVAIHLVINAAGSQQSHQM